MPGRVDLGFENRQSAPPEEAADPCKQVLLIGKIDGHLQPGFGPRQPRLDDGRGAGNAPVQVPRVPCNLVRGVPLEVDVVELGPQCALRSVGNRVEPQQALRFALPREEAVGERHFDADTREPRAGQMKQVFEELRLPRVPDPRARAANVSDRQEIEER
jgi:hypothetical protein